MIHLNGNIICAIDVETTGTDPNKHEIIEICVLPLDSKLEVSRKHILFNIKMKPDFPERIEPEALQVTQTNLMDIMTNGMDKWDAADLFEKWFEKLELPERKRIMPLAHNWVFDQAFVKNWLGNAAFDLYFDGRYRDTMVVGNFLNDVLDRKNERHPYPKVNLSYMAAMLKLEYDKLHNALDDCVLTTKVYKELVYKGH